MAQPFDISIPMKDHPMIVTAQSKPDTSNTYDLYYCDALCGCIFCNEHNIWIYEPHAHAGLLLNAEQIQFLGKEISNKS